MNASIKLNIKRNILSLDVVRVCSKAIRAWDKNWGFVVLKKTLEARIKACNDVSFCAMNYLKETVVPPELNFTIQRLLMEPRLPPKCVGTLRVMPSKPALPLVSS